uniref:Uncharacterized protein n=1 Tax=Arundo donax TaxID=35708 RepID=A0A0A9AWF9_ARUDO
MVYGMESVPCC